MPTKYLATLAAEQEERRRQQTVMPRLAPSQRYRSAADWKAEAQPAAS